MAVLGFVVVLGVLAACSALPANDPIIRKLDDGLRFQYVQGDDGQLHLQDMWMRSSDLEEAARYDPDRQNIYHLFTRDNPVVSQPLLHGSDGLLGITNYNSRRRTIILVHGWRSGMTSDFIISLVPAFLSAEDVNVIVLDWNAGAGSINYATAVTNTITCGESLARFIIWLNAATGASPYQYHLVGHSLGAHLIGVAGRNLGGQLAYLTGLEAALPGFISNDDRFRADDARYTEVIHTNAGVLGYLTELGHVDFYPNGGLNMPGCNSQECDHARSYFYLAESLTSGGFTGTRCASYAGALTGNCLLWGRLQMGGLVPKTGSTGIYYLETNPSPPFSKA